MQNETSVGERLRSVRKAYGFSQRRLAKLSGVSNAAISLIEMDKTNPSLGLLLRILRVFPMTISEFWDVEPGISERAFFTRQDLTKVSTGPVTYWQVGDASKDSAFIFQQERYTAGTDAGETQTPEDSEMAGIILEGKIEISVGDQRRVLHPGDAYRFNGKIPHRFRVMGKSDVVMVSCTVPPSF